MDVLQNGRGPLFTDPDPDHARAHFRTKSRALVSKLTTPKEAIARFVHDGDYIGVGGFGGVRIPTALLHEIMRQGRKNLGFSGHTATHDNQLMAAAEAYDRCDIAYVIGLEARGLSPQSRRYFESGKVKVCEWSNAGLLWRYQAAAQGIPFMPSRSALGTGTGERSGYKVVACPFTGKPVALYPALYPDVALIHVHEADVFGNARIEGIDVADSTLAKAAKHVLLTAERIVSTDEIRRDPGRTKIPYYTVDAVCHVPFGSYPGNMPYLYFSDEEHLRQWLESEKDPVAHGAFVERLILSSRDFDDYLSRCGGLARLAELQRLEQMVPKPADAL